MSTSLPSTIDQTLRTVQLLVAALALGLFVAGLIIGLTVLSHGQPFAPAAVPPVVFDLPGITAVSLLIFGILATTALWLPRAMSRSIARRLAQEHSLPAATFSAWDQENTLWFEQLPAGVSQQLLAGYTGQRVAAAVMIEAAGMLAAVAFLLEGHWLAFLLWSLCIALILYSLPTQTKFAAWLKTQRENFPAT
jgi:hypothetical protein